MGFQNNVLKTIAYSGLKLNVTSFRSCHPVICYVTHACNIVLRTHVTHAGTLSAASHTPVIQCHELMSRTHACHIPRHTCMSYSVTCACHARTSDAASHAYVTRTNITCHIAHARMSHTVSFVVVQSHRERLLDFSLRNTLASCLVASKCRRERE